MTDRMKGRTCFWCGKPGGTAMTWLRRFCDSVGLQLKNDSVYAHGGLCANRARTAAEKKTAPATTHIGAPLT